MSSIDYQLGFTAGYARAKAEVKHGHWEVGYAPYGFVVHRCSLCGHTIEAHEDSNYCPYCGAKMQSTIGQVKSTQAVNEKDEVDNG